MKPKKHGAKYQITYRCPNYPKIINESFDSEEEAYLRIEIGRASCRERVFRAV